MKYLKTPVYLVIVLMAWSMSLAASTLTEKDVQNVISLMGESDTLEQDIERLVPELAERREAREQEMREKMMRAMMGGEGNPTELVMESMESGMREDMAIIRNNPEANAKVTAMAREHGFSGVDEWMDTFLRVINAHLAVMSEQPNPEMDAMIEEMESMPGVPKEQIEEMKAQVRQMQETQRQYFSSVPDADKRAVRPFMDELNQVMNVYDEDDGYDD